MKSNLSQSLHNNQKHKLSAYFIDLLLYISVMFLIREVYFEQFNFMVNGLFWSTSTLIIATWRMKARGVSWKDLGLRKPESFKKMTLITAGTVVVIVLTIITFQIVKDQLPFVLNPDTSSATATSKFGNLKGNWMLFFTILPMILIESCLEELLDRGFLMNWLEKVFSKTGIATILAVLLQAAIFGFRHSYDLSERSITVGLIGLVMGISYVLFGRNLWPIIIAHCILNTMSMMDRV